MWGEKIYVLKPESFGDIANCGPTLRIAEPRTNSKMTICRELFFTKVQYGGVDTSLLLSKEFAAHQPKYTDSMYYILSLDLPNETFLGFSVSRAHLPLALTVLF